LTGEGCGFDGTCCLGVLFGSGDVVGCFFMSYFGPLVVACHHVSYYCLGGCLWMMMWVSKEVVADVVVERKEFGRWRCCSRLVYFFLGSICGG